MLVSDLKKKGPMYNLIFENTKLKDLEESVFRVESSVDFGSFDDVLFVLKARAFGGVERNYKLRYLGGRALLYMIIERFKNQDPIPVYRRFQHRGRLAPDGVRYVSSWAAEKFEWCFQLMKAENRKPLDESVGNWNDLVEFEVYPVISSKEAAEDDS